MQNILFGILFFLAGTAHAQDVIYDEFHFDAIDRDVELVIHYGGTFRCGKTIFNFRLKKNDPKFNGKFRLEAENAELIDEFGYRTLLASDTSDVQLTVTFINSKGESSNVKTYELGRLCTEKAAPKMSVYHPEPPTRVPVYEEGSTSMREVIPAPPHPNETPVPSPNQIIDFPDVDPSYVGGEEAMLAFIESTKELPPEVEIQEGKNTVYLSFVVEPDGTLTGIIFKRGVSKEVDAEAKRIVGKMPPWNPGEAGGKAVRVRYHLKIEF